MSGIKTHTSPAFKKWFKGSKVVDEHGNPLKLYHGTNRNFEKFVVGDAPGWGSGIYLTDNPENASEFGDKVLQVFASIKNPVYEKDLHKLEGKIRATKAWNVAIKKEIDRQLRRQGYLTDDESQIDLDYNEVLQDDFQVINAALRELGYDGIIAQNSNNIEGSEIIAFYSEQVVINLLLEQRNYRQNQAAAPSLQAQREQRFESLVALYTKAVAAGKIKEEFKDAIELEFSKLGQEINLNFQDIYGKRRPQTTLRSVSTDSGQGGGSSQGGTAPESGGKSVPEHAPLSDRPSGSSQRHDASTSTVAAGQKENFSLRTTPDIQLSRKERIELNRAAAALLKEKRSTYSTAELKTLALYTGQGGLLSVDVGVLNQHYTRYSLARFMWAALIRMGFKGGWVIEPGCGVGNFIGTKPDNTNVLAFDFDALAVQIASSLYPADDVRQADIKSFDFAPHQQYITAAIGNPPFGNYSRFSRNDTFAALKPKIHDHFILKMLETVRPGGLVAVISSTGTMDKKNESTREAMVNMAHFLGSYRLPSSTFEANASTTVTTDVMFFQKRDTQRDLSEQDRLFVTSAKVDSSGVHMSSWYQAHPECILGTLEVGAGQFGSQIAVRGSMDENTLETVLNSFSFKALENVPDAIKQPEQLKNSTKVQLPDEAASANSILFILKQLISAQKERASASQKSEIRTDLKKAITEHIKAYGWFEKSKVIEQFFGQTPDFNQLRAVARPGKGNAIDFSEIVERDTIFNAEFAPKLRTDKLSETILYCRQTGLRSDLDVLIKITGFSAGKIKEMAERDPSAFLDPASQTYKIRPEYISGNLKEKLELATQAGLQKNVTAISEMMPPRKPASQINFDLADVNTYLPLEVAQAYIKYATGGELGGTRRAWAIPKYNTGLSQMSGWGWKGDYASIIEYYLNGSDYPKQRIKADADDKLKQKAQEDQVLNSNKMRRLIPKRFTEWIVEIADDELRQKAVDAWNDTYNVTIEPDYTGDTFSCANMGSVWTNGQPFAPRDHQKKWIEKALLVGAGINSHGVGAGKTLSAILLAGLMKERGIANKPMFVVPNKVVEKWIDEYQHAFPGANVLNLKTDKKNKEFMLSMAQQNDYDAIFVTHEGFKSIPNSPELIEEYQALRLEKIHAEIEKVSSQITDAELAAVRDSASGKTVKLRNPLQKILKKMFVALMNMEQKVSIALESTKLNSIYFDELGVDSLIVDEAHNFKNLFLSSMAVELGIGVGTSSDRAEEAFAKFHYINQTMGNRNVFLLTATPTNNTPLEAYILLSAVAPQYIDKLKIDDVDSFINQYARVESVQTADMLGNFKDKLIVTGYKNLDTLRGVFNRFVEFIDTTDFPEVRKILPVATYNPVYLEPGNRDQAIITNLNARVDAIKSYVPFLLPNKRTGEDSRDNYLFVAGSGSRAAVDPAFYVLETVPVPDGNAEKWLYKARLHDGANPDDLIWMEWRKPIAPDLATTVAAGIRRDETKALIRDLQSGSSEDRRRANILTELASGSLLSSRMAGSQLYDQLCIAIEGKAFTGKLMSGRLVSNWLTTQANVAGVKFEAQQGKSSAFNYVMFDDSLVQVEDKIRVNAGGVEVWHGTKHDFDSFSTSHVGRGEGQHLYGWGIYFTEARSVAEWYADSVSQSGVDMELDTGKIESDSKAGIMCKTLADNYWKQSRDVEGKDGTITENAKNGQLIFCDPITTTKGRNYHRLLRDTLVSMGIPKNEIAIINGGENAKPEQKIKVQEQFNKGSIRVIIGNTASMGEGMDLNRFCTDIHHLDVPWKPSELTQRNGRGVRQGNVNAEVRIHYYLLRKSLDAYRYTLLNKKANWIRELWYGKDTEMESEDTESGGWDYETIMMALLDDPEKQQALEISRDLKRSVSMYNNLSDDFQSYKANIVALRQERDDYSRGQATYAYAKIESLPEISSDGERTLKSLQNTLSRSGWQSGYVQKKDGGYERGLTIDYMINGVNIGGLAISEQRDGQTMYAYGRLFDRAYYGSDSDYKALEKKLYDFVDRFANSYHSNRKTRIDKYNMYGQRVETFEKREEQTKYEVAEAAMNVIGILAKADNVTSTNPAIGRYFDERYMGETRGLFESRKGWAEKTYQQGIASGLLSADTRTNPGGALHLAYLGKALKLHTNSDEFSGSDFMFSDATGSKLYIIPASRVRSAGKTVNAPAAQRMHEEFKRYAADGRDFQITMPDGKMKQIGFAEKIWYASDKIMQNGDHKGKTNYYVHDFDKQKRPVYMHADILVITNLEIDGRGILN